jgi:sugar lactone lactonase YvrE
MIELKAIKKVDHKNILGEGPVWDEKAQALYWVDILDDRIFKLDTQNKSVKSIEVDAYPSSIILTKDGTMIVTALDKLLEIPLTAFEEEDKSSDFALNRLEIESDIVGEDKSEAFVRRFNDGKADASGRLWLGTMVIEQEKGQGKSGLYCLNSLQGAREEKTKLLLEAKVEKTTISNGLCWDLSRKVFYFIDSPKGKIARYSWDESSGKIRFLDYCITLTEEEHTPDGMTIDCEGNLWIACWGGSQVFCADPISGKRLVKVHVGAANVTCPVFGGKDLSTLYITTAKDEKACGGELYFVETSVKGKIGHRC